MTVAARRNGIYRRVGDGCLKNNSTRYNNYGTLSQTKGDREVYEMGRNIIMIRNKNHVEKMTNPLQIRRVLAGMRQRDLADVLGRPVSFIGKIESDQVNINNLSMANGYRLSQVLGCNMEDLLKKDELDIPGKVQKKVQ